MNKWEDSFKKQAVRSDNKLECFCSKNQGLFIPNRKLSLVVAGLLFLLFSIFIGGYFLGKRYCAEQFTSQVYQESLSDQVYASVVAIPDIKADQLNGEDVTDLLLRTTQETSEHSVNETLEQIILSEDECKKYYAQLVGFGTEKAAYKFVEKLASKNILTSVKKRVSKSAKGRTTYWYQVVTAEYVNRNDLSALVSRLEKEETLKGVCIVTC